MQAFTVHQGVVATLDRANVDTDQIIPKQFLKRIERSGFGQYLFFDWRFLPDGAANPDFALNQPAWSTASILVARRNFGSGSSREHAVWALEDYGFRVVIAPSFADIFYNNCFKNGVLPITLDEADVEHLFQLANQAVPLQMVVDLENQTLRTVNATTESATLFVRSFEVADFRRHCMLNGLDDIGLTLQHEAMISAYEQARSSTPVH
ncbi:3-isopropylmalate dehydratase small subunit [Planctomycetaceae bacterium SH139]